MSETTDTVKKILVTKIYVETPVDEIDDSASLRNAYAVDSLGFIELRAQLEDTYGIVIDDDSFTPETFATVGDLAALVDRIRAAGAPADARVGS